jgi:hypothetical protein
MLVKGGWFVTVYQITLSKKLSDRLLHRSSGGGSSSIMGLQKVPSRSSVLVTVLSETVVINMSEHRHVTVLGIATHR